MEGKSNYIKNVEELDVYQRLFRLSKVVILKVIPKLPVEEKYDLCQQMRRASKAATAMLTEGFPKRFQPKYWDRYIIDAIGECEEMITYLRYVQDIYFKQVIPDSVAILIKEYRHASNQLYSLNKAWKDYHRTKNK